MLKIGEYEKQNIADDFNNWLKEDYYKILEISSKANFDEINKAFKKKIKSCNPALYPENSMKRIYAELRLKHLIEIRDTLLNPRKREKYDNERQILQDCYISFMASNTNLFEKGKRQVRTPESINQERIKNYVKKNHLSYDIPKSQLADLNDMFQLYFSREEFLH